MAEQLLGPQARRGFLRLAGAAGVSILLGGCQIVPTGAPGPPPPPQPEARPTPAPQPTVTPGLPQDQQRHRVAILVPLSGANAGVGQSIANAANLALLDAGAERVRITAYDTARGASLAANQALADGNRVFLGPLLAEDVQGVAPIARRADVPVIAFSNDVSVAGDGVYVMGFNPSQSIERVIGHARDQGLQRFAGLIPAGIYGQRASQALLQTVERSGGRLVAMQTYERSPAALRAAVGRLNAQSGYDAVLIADSARNAVIAAPLIRGGGSRGARILGTELWSTETNLPAMAALRGAWFASASDTMFNQLRTRYRARYGSAPYRLASLGYDAALMAVRISQGWRFGQPFPAAAIRDPEGFSGLDGAFRFGRGGVVERALEVRQIDAGRLTTVSPAARGFAR